MFIYRCGCVFLLFIFFDCQLFLYSFKEKVRAFLKVVIIFFNVSTIEQLSCIN